jgi:hypothetical protein
MNASQSTCMVQHKSSKMVHFVFKCNKEDYLSLCDATLRWVIIYTTEVKDIFNTEVGDLKLRISELVYRRVRTK